jgi:hypothetical protein
MARSKRDDENGDWLGKSPEELTAKLDDVKVEEVLDVFDLWLNSCTDGTPHPF